MVGGWFPELAVRSLILYHLQFRYIMDTCEQNASSGRIQYNHFNQPCSSCSSYLANHCTCITLVVHLYSLASVLVVLSLNQLQLTCRYVDIDIAFPVAKPTYLGITVPDTANSIKRYLWLYHQLLTSESLRHLPKVLDSEQIR